MSTSILLWLALSPQAATPPATPPVVTAAATQSTAPADKLICKRYAEAGSNIARNKRCLTRAQWDQTARDAQGVRRSIEQTWTTPNQ